MPGHPDLMEDAPVNDKGPQARRHQSFRENRATRGADLHPVKIVNAFLLSQLRTEFKKQFRLQFRQPRAPSATAVKIIVENYELFVCDNS
jgi:hypothetical protein